MEPSPMPWVSCWRCQHAERPLVRAGLCRDCTDWLFAEIPQPPPIGARLLPPINPIPDRREIQ